MRRVKRVGLMEVHTQQFCDTCLPYPETIISIISRRLPEIAFNKNLELLTIIKVDVLSDDIVAINNSYVLCVD